MFAIRIVVPQQRILRALIAPKRQYCNRPTVKPKLVAYQIRVVESVFALPPSEAHQQLNSQGYTPEEQLKIAIEVAEALMRSNKLDDALEWLSLVPRVPGPNAMYATGLAFRLMGCPDQAVQLFQKGLEQGDARCARQLGTLSLPKNLEEGMKFLELAGSMGDALSHFLLGQIWASRLSDGAEDANILNKVKYHYQEAQKFGTWEGKLGFASLQLTGIDVGLTNEEAFSTAKEIADKGIPDAMTLLGLITFNTHDFKTSAHYFRLILQNNPDDQRARRCYGLMLFDGNGVEKDEEAAFKILLPVANSFLDIAELVGKMYLYGIGTEANPEEGIEWLKRAAERGSGSAMYELSVAYYNGTFVEKNDEKSFEWTVKSANAGYPDGINALAARLIKNQQYDGAIELYHGLAEAGHEVAFPHFWQLWIKIFRGSEAEEHQRWHDFAVNRCIPVIRKLVKEGDVQLAISLSVYFGQDGSDAEKKEAYDTLHEFRSSQDSTVLLLLGYCYEEGIGTSISLTEAVKYYRLSAGQNNTHALNLLFEMYYSGRGVKQDMKEAAKLAQLSANQNNIPAIYFLSQMYRQGHGVEKDLKKADELLRTAADAGLPEAISELEQSSMHME